MPTTDLCPKRAEVSLPDDVRDELQRCFWANEIMEVIRDVFGIEQPAASFVAKMTDLIRADALWEIEDEIAMQEMR